MLGIVRCYCRYEYESTERVFVVLQVVCRYRGAVGVGHVVGTSMETMPSVRTCVVMLSAFGTELEVVSAGGSTDRGWRAAIPATLYLICTGSVGTCRAVM